MTQHPLSNLSFLKPLSNLENTSFGKITQNAEDSYLKNKNKEEGANPLPKRKILTPIKTKKISESLIKEISLKEKMPLFETTPQEEITFQKIEENAEKFKSDFKEITNIFKEQIKDLSVDLQESKKQLDTLLSLKKKEKSSSLFSFFKKNKENKETKSLSTQKPLVVVKRPYSSDQIIDSKTLLTYASDWTRTIFSERILFKAIPGSGTILLILPKGNIRFIQFNYKDTPVHPTQENFKLHLSPHKVYEFNQFIDYRNWIYSEIGKI